VRSGRRNSGKGKEATKNPCQHERHAPGYDSGLGSLYLGAHVRPCTLCSSEFLP
jgi:hypothetical protein